MEEEDTMNQISDNEEFGDASGEESTEDVESQCNLGWADAISKVLRTNVAKKKCFILSKAKKDRDILEKKQDVSVEIVGESGLVIQPTEADIKGKRPTKNRKKEDIVKLQKKYLWENMCRMKPDITNKEKERMLVRIATKGVVHLFNAVEKHQKSKNSPSKKDAKKQRNSIGVRKGTFMDMLKGDIHQHNKTESLPSEPAPKKESWSALKDNFMMGASIKDWDKESSDVDMK